VLFGKNPSKSLGETRNAYGILVGKLEGKRCLERSRHIWKIILE
jgi:hypothetical protein